MCQFDRDPKEWEPEPLHIGVELGVEPPPPRHEDAQDSDESARIIVIDLA
jgi:hypothetical protein